MKKPDNIPKKEFFNVPDGYFESLPGRIQARISKELPIQEQRFVTRYKLQYVFPVIIVLAATIFWFIPSQKSTDVQTLLSQVETKDLVRYLSESDITTEDILENVDFNSIDAEAIENEVYESDIDAQELDEILFDLNSENI
jgi:hypothetical protein